MLYIVAKLFFMCYMSRIISGTCFRGWYFSTPTRSYLPTLQSYRTDYGGCWILWWRVCVRHHLSQAIAFMSQTDSEARFVLAVTKNIGWCTWHILYIHLMHTILYTHLLLYMRVYAIIRFHPHMCRISIVCMLRGALFSKTTDISA